MEVSVSMNNSNIANKLVEFVITVLTLPENALLELPTERGLNLKPSDLHSCLVLKI